MRRVSIAFLLTGLWLALLAGPVPAQDSLRLTGSGATFPFPLYSAWFKSFSSKHKSVTVDYQGKGSGAGVRDFVNRTVDFAASDAAMTDEEISKVPGGVQMLPMTGGEVVVGYNLPGNPKGLKLPRDVYAAIFLGKITKWSDPKLKAANPGVSLPDTDITVVRRADSSGTTFVFTSHLSAISEEWKKGPGAGTTVNWPEERQVRRLAEERRCERDHQADARRHRVPRVRLRQVRQDGDRPAAEQSRSVRRAGRRGRDGGARQREAAGRPARVGVRSRGRQGLSDHDVHLDAVLQGEQGSQEGGGDPRACGTTASTRARR